MLGPHTSLAGALLVVALLTTGLGPVGGNSIGIAFSGELSEASGPAPSDQAVTAADRNWLVFLEETSWPVAWTLDALHADRIGYGIVPKHA